MKLNISYPVTGCQKLLDIDDEKRVRVFYEKRIGQEVEADSIGDEWKGYVFRISGGNDKQGFPMKQGVLTNGRVRLLLAKGHSCYRPRRSGERKRKSVRGCIVDSNMSVVSLVVKKKGDQDIAGLTDTTLPRRLGPKRASKIRKLFNLTKEDDVRQYVVRRPLPAKEGKDGKQLKERTKAPKIQRLITPLMLQHKRRKQALKKNRGLKRMEESAEYARLLKQRANEAQEKKAELARKRRSTRESHSSAGEAEVPAKKGKKEKPEVTKKESKEAKKAIAKDAKEAKKATLKSAKEAKKATLKKGGKEAKSGKDKDGKKTTAAPAKKDAAKTKTAAPAKAAPAPKEKEAPKAKPAAPKAAAPAAKAAAPAGKKAPKKK